MIDIVRASFNFDTPAPPEDDLIAYARRVFDKMDAAAEGLLPFEDYSLYLAVEEGSVKGFGKVAVYASAFVTCVAQYGSFIQGLEIIKRQGNDVAQAIIRAASGDEMMQNIPIRTRVDAGKVARLKRLFVKVRDREIGPEEATQQALTVLDPTKTELPPDAQTKIAVAFRSLRLNPEQLPLDLEIRENAVPPYIPTPRQKKSMPAEQHLLVVIERKEKLSQPLFRKKYR